MTQGFARILHTFTAPLILVAIGVPLIACGGGSSGGGGSGPTMGLTKLTPARGGPQGGTLLILNGTHFVPYHRAGDGTIVPDALVTVAGRPATSVMLVDGSTIVCIAPPGSVGTPVDVAVTTSSGTATLPACFTYVSDPPVFVPPEVRLDTDPAGSAISTFAQICCDGANVYTVWEDWRSGTGDIYFSRSQDGGATWLADDVRLDTDPPGNANSYDPVISCDGSNVYVVWWDWRDGAGDIYFNRSQDGGTTWLADDVRLDTDAAGAGISAYPRICSSGSNVCVVWEDWRDENGDIYLNCSPDGGSTWLAADLRIDTNTAGDESAVFPQICCDGASVYVAWEDWRSGAGDIYANRSLDGGKTWLAKDIRLDTDIGAARNSYDPKICCEGSKVYVVWDDWRDGAGDIRFNRSLDGGATWLVADVRLDTFPAADKVSVYPKICCDGSNVYVAWTDARSGAEDIYFNRSLDSGTTWLDNDVRLDTDIAGEQKSVKPRICCEGSNVYVVWEDWRTGAGAIHANRSQDGGETWLASDLRLDSGSAGATNSYDPQICCGGPNVFVVWDDWRDGLGDIYLNFILP